MILISGRNFRRQFEIMEFDFTSNGVRIGAIWKDLLETLMLGRDYLGQG